MIFSRFDLPPEVDPAAFPNVKAGPSGEHALAATIDRTVFPGVQGGPLMHVIAGKAVAFQQALGDEFRRDQRRTIENAATIAGVLVDRGFRVVSGGTDNHLMLVDVMSRGVTGKDAEHLLDEIGVTVNKNQIPFDRQPPNTSSGIRIGTPAVTARGMGGDEMREIAAIIADAIDGREDAAATAGLRARVAAIAGRFPVPGLRRPT
jgi:glycine hydroxymethyltransferase